jgi:hypothetical protein
MMHHLETVSRKNEKRFILPESIFKRRFRHTQSHAPEAIFGTACRVINVSAWQSQQRRNR